jgi:magnesium-transporting ATPase (P-type)
LTRSLETLGTRIAVLILVLATGMTAIGLLVHDDSPKDLLDSAITFAVAAVPEGLPAIVTITLAIGLQQMARQRAIARKLTAVETLGEVTTICSDKTGTLTRNEMTARVAVAGPQQFRIEGEGYRPEGRVLNSDIDVPVAHGEQAGLDALVLAMALCNDAALRQEGAEWTVVGAPTDGSLLVLAGKYGVEVSGHLRFAELPFDSATKAMAIIDRDPAGETRLIVKGAPDRLLERSVTELALDGTVRPLDRERWETVIDDLGSDGRRVLAAAWSPSEWPRDLSFEEMGGLTFLGVVGIADPPRAEAIDAIARCRRAGVRVTMITGDHATTAAAISRELGIPSGDHPRLVTGMELEQMSDHELAAVAADVDVFARTSPEHKLRIVRALQSQGQIVAMTGDGVNDAPALVRADIGIAMGINGTEATKEAADIVLADDNFATIERAIAEGRRIFDNIQKSLMFILPTTFAQALVVLTAVVFGFVPPMQPTQVLWVNLVTAITLALALAYEPAERGVMERPPRRVTGSVIDPSLRPRVLWATLLIAASTIIVFFFAQGAGASLPEARTAAVTMLVLGQVAYLFNSRFLRLTSFSPNVFLGNRVLWWAIGTLLVLQLLFTYLPIANEWFHTVPISWSQWGMAAGIALIIFVAVEVEKAVTGLVRRRTAATTARD